MKYRACSEQRVLKCPGIFQNEDLSNARLQRDQSTQLTYLLFQYISFAFFGWINVIQIPIIIFVLFGRRNTATKN